MDEDNKYNIESKIKSKRKSSNKKKVGKIVGDPLPPMVSTLVPYCRETSLWLAREKPDSRYATGNS